MERIPDGKPHLIHDRCPWFWGAFVRTLAAARESVKPPRSPDRMILFGEGALRPSMNSQRITVWIAPPEGGKRRVIPRAME
jgi:hypothetical protein